MTDTPQVLLQHHLKKLRLPTFLGEYSRLAQQCAAEKKDHVDVVARTQVVLVIGCSTSDLDT